MGHLLDIVLGLEGSEGFEEGQVGQGAVAERESGLFAHL
jgi:hypothetical protein